MSEKKTLPVDVVIVGSGPVGLFMAIQIKLLQPKFQVLMYEKYSTYQRHHSVYLSKSSIGTSIDNTQLQSLLNGLSGNVTTSFLESELKSFALTIGISILYEHITSTDILFQRHPFMKYLIGADGSHSVVHRDVFHGEYQIKRVFRSIVEIKYHCRGKTTKYNLAAKLDSQHLTMQFIGKYDEKNNSTPVALRFFVSDEEAKQLSEATFKNPWTIDNDGIPATLKASILTSMNNRKDVVLDTARLVLVNLPTYASAKFYTIKNGVRVYLVGDAAVGIPYYRSLNNGFLCANFLVQNLDRGDHYEAFVNQRVSMEHTVAKIKNTSITSLDKLHHAGFKTSKCIIG